MEEKIPLVQELEALFPGKLRPAPDLSQDDVFIVDRDFLPECAARLKQRPFDYTMLLDLTCVDYLAREGSLEMVYTFFSLVRRRRLRLKARLPQDDLRIGSLAALWKNADWLEREVFDLFGVGFEGHPDLRRILLYEGFEGHPLRKSYPLRRRQPREASRK
jgi:NADH-quinone oxidoreductase subunit C